MKSKLIPLCWIFLWLGIYAAIILTGIFLPDSGLATFIKLSGIFLCLLYVTIHYHYDYLLWLALFMTCIADLILAINNISIIGVFVFLLAQVFHSIRLRPQPKIYLYIIYVASALALIIINLFRPFLPGIFIAASFYVMMLLFNLYTAYRIFRNRPHNWHAFCALSGFFLFFCCDFAVGCSYLARISVLPGHIFPLTNFIAWAFYYPSQVLISNSSLKNKKYDTIKPREGNTC